ncbi:MAG: 30S ribosomal protein S17 [Candidatus Melainabacteria bacterium RIFCSPLOWO2_02_FULL_35_15]|nr:MAG: 30S ribosomal protein S17 [Candidatus Melainabacteria bacterium RIFCSPLOWO2_12_FULL_35_11]OGI12859.1 MAG: 30S ribosomal protein S17 [Candidatus Melainabacteria bacterium RIFCSPLOWO2_02_FULL_35_15]
MPKKVLKGKVVSDKMDKTIVVAIENKRLHPRYKKLVLKTRKFKAHDESNQCKTGDVVEIIEHVPMSKTKRWLLKEVLVKAD